MEIKSLNIKLNESYITIPATKEAIFLCRLLGKKDFKDVLELGTGTGIISIYLAKKGCNVTATDIDDRIIGLAKKNAELNNVKIKFLISDIYENVTGRYDCIIFSLPPIFSSKRFNYLTFLYETIIPNSIDPYLAKFLYFIMPKISKQKRGKLMHIIQASKAYLKKGGYVYLIIHNTDLLIFKNIEYINYEIIEFPYFIDYYIIKASYK